MKKYTFTAVIDNKVVFTDGKDFYIDTALTEADIATDMFTESDIGLIRITDAKLLQAANEITKANRLRPVSVINFNSRIGTATVRIKSDGTAEQEEAADVLLELENVDLESISDAFLI